MTYQNPPPSDIAKCLCGPHLAARLRSRQRVPYLPNQPGSVNSRSSTSSAFMHAVRDSA